MPTPVADPKVLCVLRMLLGSPVAEQPSGPPYLRCLPNFKVYGMGNRNPKRAQIREVETLGGAVFPEK